MGDLHQINSGTTTFKGVTLIYKIVRIGTPYFMPSVGNCVIKLGDLKLYTLQIWVTHNLGADRCVIKLGDLTLHTLQIWVTHNLGPDRFQLTLRY